MRAPRYFFLRALGLGLALFSAAGAVRIVLKGAPAANNSRRFVDITTKSGIRFLHNTGAFGKRFLPETMGSGCAFFDYDNDGNPDILLVQGKDFSSHKTRRTTLKLYRNNGNGTFTDVTVKAGLDVEIYGMGVAEGGYEKHGWDGHYVNGLGESRPFINATCT